jgi:hypothetical protein
MYKSGQTPDDVYFSPGVEQSGYARTNDRADEEDGYVDMNDRYLRMKTNSRRWSAFDDDFAYWNNPMWNNQMAFNSWNRPWGWNSGWNVGVGFGNAWGNPWMWNNPWAWNSPWGFNSGWGMNAGWGWGAGMGWGRPGMWNNPFCPTFYGNPIVNINPKPMGNPRANGPRTYNLNTYNPRSGMPSYMDPKTSGRTSYTSNTGARGVRVFNNMTTTTNSTGGGRYIRIDGTGTGSSARPRGGYSGYDNNSGTRSSNPSRTFEPRSSSGGSSGRSFGGGSGSSGGSAPTRSFGGRGGGN